MSLFRRNKNNNKPVIRQIIDLIPKHLLILCVSKFKSDKYCYKYKTYDQLVSSFVRTALYILKYDISHQPQRAFAIYDY
ncbi:MAG: DUF4372 domain-containing protein [Bacteroidetes bacterium]|nr:DUF4372 domain-containing protein [Bacteroidota bacterium]